MYTTHMELATHMEPLIIFFNPNFLLSFEHPLFLDLSPFRRCFAFSSLLQAVLASGIRSLAVVLKHAAVFPDHEKTVGKLARELGFEQARACASFVFFV